MYLQTGGEGEGETAGGGQVVGVSLDPHLWSPVSAEEEVPGADVQGQCDREGQPPAVEESHPPQHTPQVLTDRVSLHHSFFALTWQDLQLF